MASLLFHHLHAIEETLSIDFSLRWMVWTEDNVTPPTAVPVPTDNIISAVQSPVTCVTRHVDILNSDETPYALDVPMVDGSITISMSATEKRTLQLTLGPCDDDDLEIVAGKLWYDKLIRPYRGVTTATESYEALLGTFMIDRLSVNHTRSTIEITGRDMTKKLVSSKFAFPTMIPANEPIEVVISNLAYNGGVTKQFLPLTGISTDREFSFDTGADRWASMVEIARAYLYELYFDVDGTLVMAEQADPFLDPVTYVFQTGVSSNLSSFKKEISDTRVKNHIVVKGKTADDVPLIAEARNTNPASATNVAILGERTDVYDSAFVTDLAQAQAMADRFLTMAALESFDVPLEGIVVPWLDVNTVVSFLDPEPAAGDPTRYLMTDLTIPLGLSPMQATIRRVVAVS